MVLIHREVVWVFITISESLWLHLNNLFSSINKIIQAIRWPSIVFCCKLSHHKYKKNVPILFWVNKICLPGFLKETRFFQSKNSCKLERVMVFYCHFQQYFSYIVAVSFISGGNWSTWRNHWPAASHWQTLSHNVMKKV
jgi:hypothetical protein